MSDAVLIFADCLRSSAELTFRTVNKVAAVFASFAAVIIVEVLPNNKT